MGPSSDAASPPPATPPEHPVSASAAVARRAPGRSTLFQMPAPRGLVERRAVMVSSFRTDVRIAGPSPVMGCHTLLFDGVPQKAPAHA
ncbi:hypothetical protein ACFPRL_24580 [Pseudoclavibacter helvolus]